MEQIMACGVGACMGCVIKTVKELQRRGVEFLTIPTTYYDVLEERVGPIDEDLESLKEFLIRVQS